MCPPPAAPTPSRRAVLRGAVATVGLVAITRTSACGTSGAADDEDALAALGRALARSPDGERLAAAAPEGLRPPVADRASLLAGLAALDASVRADFAEGRTVLAEGWLLSDTEAAALVAYAHG